MNKIHLIIPDIQKYLFIYFFFLNIFEDEIMAQHSPSKLNIDTLSRSGSSASIKSAATVDSTRSSTSSWLSSTSSQKRRGILGKVGTRIQSVFRRFSRTHISLTEMEIQILLTMTNFTREEILEW
jgi:hypothetical protein